MPSRMWLKPSRTKRTAAVNQPLAQTLDVMPHGLVRQQFDTFGRNRFRRDRSTGDTPRDPTLDERRHRRTLRGDYWDANRRHSVRARLVQRHAAADDGHAGARHLRVKAF